MTELKTYRVIYEGIDGQANGKYFNKYEIILTAVEKPTLESLITQKRIYQCFHDEIVKKFSVEEI